MMLTNTQPPSYFFLQSVSRIHKTDEEHTQYFIHIHILMHEGDSCMILIKGMNPYDLPREIAALVTSDSYSPNTKQLVIHCTRYSQSRLHLTDYLSIYSYYSQSATIPQILVMQYHKTFCDLKQVGSNILENNAQDFKII